MDFFLIHPLKSLGVSMYAQLVRSEITFTLLPTFNLITLEEVSAGELFTVELVAVSYTHLTLPTNREV